MATLALRDLELNWIYLIVCLNKIWHCWAYCSVFLNKFKSDSWEPWSPCGGACAQHPGPSYCQGLFWWLSGVGGWVLSSQLRLSKAEILSALNLRNSKSWWTCNLDIMNRPRLPPNNWLGSQGHLLHQGFYSVLTLWQKFQQFEQVFTFKVVANS